MPRTSRNTRLVIALSCLGAAVLGALLVDLAGSGIHGRFAQGSGRESPTSLAQNGRKAVPTSSETTSSAVPRSERSPAPAVTAAPGPTVTRPAAATGPLVGPTATAPVTAAPRSQLVVAPRASPSCGLSAPAFCETFDQPSPTPGTRSGDLNGVLWGVSRATSADNPPQGLDYQWADVALDKCGTTVTAAAPNDVQICNGQVVEGINDNGGQNVLAMYPRQPFDIAGRTGTVSFDVSSDSEGPHAAWPTFVYTDQPVPAPYSLASGIADNARNSFGFTLAAACYGAGNAGGNCWYANMPSQTFTGLCTTVDSMFITQNYMLTEMSPPNPGTTWGADGCVLAPTASQRDAGQLNHIEVQLSASSAVIYGSDPGSRVMRQIAHTTNLTVPLSRGLVWFEDVHYNGDKFNNQQTHTFAWDNIAFDGPVLPRDLGFDVLDNTSAGPAALNGLPTQNLGYSLPGTLTIPNVTNLGAANAALLELTFWPHNTQTLTYSVNNNPPHQFAWPFNSTTWVSQTLAMPIPLNELHTGNNTIQLSTSDPGGVDYANADLILAGAGGVHPV